MIDLTQRYAFYRSRLKEAMKGRNLTNDELADRMSAHPVTISKLRSGTLTLDDEWRAKVAAAIGLDENVLFGDGPLPRPAPTEVFIPLKKRGRKPANDNSDLPVYGLAAGSISGHLVMTNEIVETVPCPPGLKSVAGAYALRTHGESMVPRYFPKDILYINPHQALVAGDHVVIQTRKFENDGTETWVKRYDGKTDEEILVSQYNPVAKMSFRNKYVQHIHRVLPVNELYPT